MVQKSKSKYKGAIIGGAVILCLLVIAIIRLSGSDEKPKQQTAQDDNNSTSSISNSANGVVSIPGTSDRESYNKLQKQENEKNAKKAIEDGNTSLPILTNNTTENINDPFNDLNLNQVKPKQKEETPVIDTTPVTPPEPVVQQEPPVIQQQQAAPAVPAQNVYAYDERANQRQKVEAQLMRYLDQWKPAAASQERDMTGQDLEKVGMSATGNLANANSTNSLSGSNNSNNNNNAVLVRAGTVIPAVLISHLNSDTPTPVLAQVVSGELKGARFIGNMKSSNSGIVIQFDKLSMKGQPKTFATSAYAVDSTANISLATDVNNHYFLRYGLGLAAAFISGYGEAIANQNTTTTIGPLGNIVETQGELNNAQIAKTALGKVGQKLGNEIDKDSNRAPTVTVDAGTPIGILIMNDL